MTALSIRLHRFEQTLNSGLEWVETSPLPARILKITSLCFSAVAMGALMPLNMTASVTIAAASGALAVSAYVLSRLLHHRKNALFEDLENLGNVYEHSKEILNSSIEAKKLLKNFWTEERLYRMIYDPNATELEKWAYLMIPNTIRYILEGKKKDIERLYSEIVIHNQSLIMEKSTLLNIQRKDATRCELTQSIFRQLSHALTENINSEESEEIKSALEHCKETANFNAAEVEKILMETRSQIKLLEEEKAHLIDKEKRYGDEFAKLRRQLCLEIYRLLQEER